MPVPKLFLALLSVLAAPAWAGLFGTDAPGRIPIPARDFRARVEDRSGVVTELDRATFDGEVFVFGTVGLAQVAVPFETVRRLDVGSAVDEDHVIVHVTTRDGAAVDVVVDEDRPWYGRAAFGNFRIEIGQVRAIAIGE